MWGGGDGLVYNRKATTPEEGRLIEILGMAKIKTFHKNVGLYGSIFITKGILFCGPIFPWNGESVPADRLPFTRLIVSHEKEVHCQTICPKV